MCVGDGHFKHKNVPEYTKLTNNRDRAEVMNIIGLILVKKDMLQYVSNIKTARGKGLGIYGNPVILC